MVFETNGTIYITNDGDLPIDLLQNVINYNIGKKIVVGRSSSDNFRINKPLSIPSYSDIEFVGEVMMADSAVRPLTANALTGATRIYIANANQYFYPGQWVIISSDDKPLQSGGAWMTERTSDGNYIISVESDYVTVRTPLLRDFTTAANAIIAHGQSVILLDGVTGVKLTGSGVINNNSNPLARLNPLNENGINESVRQMCGISVQDCSDIRISGLTIKNAALHGLTLHDVANCDIRDLHVDSSHGKGVIVWGVSDFVVDNIHVINSYNEDGFSMYNGNVNGIVTNIRAEGSRRYGFTLIGADNENVVVDGLSLKNNYMPLWVQTAENVAINDVVITGTHANQNTPVTISESSEVRLKNVTINGVTVTRAFSVTGDTTKNIFVDDLTINEMPTTIGVTVASTCQNIIFNKAIIQDVATCIETTGGSPTNLVFKQCLFEDYTTFTIGTGIKFTKCFGTPKFVKASTVRVKNGSTFAWVNHNLDITPTIPNIKLTPKSTLGNATEFRVTSVDSIAFRIDLDVDPGQDVTFSYVISDDYIFDEEAEITYTTSHASDFSAGADSYSGTRMTVSGNNDAVGGLDNVLVAYATSVAGTHDLSRASAAQVGSTCRIRGKYRMPSGQTNADGFRIYGNTFTVTLLTKTSSSIVYDAWTEFVTDEWVADSGTIYFRLMDGGSISFTGANNASDDRLELRDVVTEYN